MHRLPMIRTEWVRPLAPHLDLRPFGESKAAPHSAVLRSTQPPDDACLVQIVWRHFHSHAVACRDTDPTFAHFPGDGRQNGMFVIQLDAEHRSGEHRLDAAFHFDMLFAHFFCLVQYRSDRKPQHPADRPGTPPNKKARPGSPEPRRTKGCNSSVAIATPTATAAAIFSTTAA